MYIKKWKKAKKAILLRNPNKIIQVMFQDQSELILSTGSGYVTFVNAKQEVKQMPLTEDENLEDKSLYKRLQYAKEILVQMISAQSMPASLALTNQAKSAEGTGAANEYATQQQRVAPGAQTNVRSSVVETNTTSSAAARHTKSASKGAAIMSPYNSKSTQKLKDSSARLQRMQTLTASKIPQSTNLLNSNIKQAQGRNPSANKFELPLLSNRSSSKPTLVKGGKSTQAAMASTQSHNFLPSKIGTGVLNQNSKTNSAARLYSTNNGKEQQSTEPSPASISATGVAVNNLRVSSQKSPGKSFKNARNTQSAAQMTTLAGGVRKQNFASGAKMI